MPLLFAVTSLLCRCGPAVLALLCFAGAAAQADEQPLIRAAVLKYGTVSWELQTLQAQRFDQQQGFSLQLVPLASMMATQTALKSGAVEVIVADWLWVARQRAAGDKLQFMPFSASVGKVVVAADSPIQQLQQLRGRRIGVAGGPLSKGWLLLQAVALQRGIDLKQESSLQFGAPPLLNAALEQGQLDAVVTFWHYAARLEARGWRALVDLDQLGRELGLSTDLPLLGYVFAESWAREHPQRVAALQRAVRLARDYLNRQEAGWQALRPQMRAEDEAVYRRLQAGYRSGTPAVLTAAHLRDAERLFQVLAEIGGAPLVGSATRLDPQLFWRGGD
ncbi:ABC transporter substrate-binding protein [Motiliproteus sediminis]|uniref:ABC transporter substrate-binding protein n=1 Tax=Motiliproteus sediminis TaxID=1468178 RepID=UPI001AF003A0|nr:ABC transporter substrate-binding protein [Motiliproteus sediminis]